MVETKITIHSNVIVIAIFVNIGMGGSKMFLGVGASKDSCVVITSVTFHACATMKSMEATKSHKIKHGNEQIPPNDPLARDSLSPKIIGNKELFRHHWNNT